MPEKQKLWRFLNRKYWTYVENCKSEDMIAIKTLCMTNDKDSLLAFDESQNHWLSLDELGFHPVLERMLNLDRLSLPVDEETRRSLWNQGWDNDQKTKTMRKTAIREVTRKSALVESVSREKTSVRKRAGKRSIVLFAMTQALPTWISRIQQITKVGVSLKNPPSEILNGILLRIYLEDKFVEVRGSFTSEGHFKTDQNQDSPKLEWIAKQYNILKKMK